MNDRGHDRSANRPRRRLALLIAAGVCAVGGAATVTGAIVTDRPAPPRSAAFDSTSAAPEVSTRSPVPSTAISSSPGEDTSPRSEPEHSPKPEKAQQSKRSSNDQIASESAPTKITIDRIGVSADFVPLDLTDNGELDTPQNPDQVGWFTGAHTPGGPGVSVVAGHVTWNGAESVFFELGDLPQGTRIKIKRADASIAIFTVQRRATFAKDTFPTEQVYRDSSEPQLVLITCGGEFDADRHYYDSNVIIWADLETIRS